MLISEGSSSEMPSAFELYNSGSFSDIENG